jgi:hypothetical protein
MRRTGWIHKTLPEIIFEGSEFYERETQINMRQIVAVSAQRHVTIPIPYRRGLFTLADLPAQHPHLCAELALAFSVSFNRTTAAAVGTGGNQRVRELAAELAGVGVGGEANG